MKHIPIAYRDMIETNISSGVNWVKWDVRIARHNFDESVRGTRCVQKYNKLYSRHKCINENINSSFLQLIEVLTIFLQIYRLIIFFKYIYKELKFFYRRIYEYNVGASMLFTVLPTRLHICIYLVLFLHLATTKRQTLK